MTALWRPEAISLSCFDVASVSSGSSEGHRSLDVAGNHTPPRNELSGDRLPGISPRACYHRSLRLLNASHRLAIFKGIVRFMVSERLLKTSGAALQKSHPLVLFSCQAQTIPRACSAAAASDMDLAESQIAKHGSYKSPMFRRKWVGIAAIVGRNAGYRVAL